MQACLRRLRGHRVIWSRSWGYRMVWTRSQGYRVIWTRSLGYRMVWSRTLLMMMTIWSLACIYVYGSMCVDVYWYPACAESAAEVLTDDEEALQMCHDAKLKAELESFQGTHTQEEGLAEVGQKRPVPTPLRADLPLPKKLRRPPPGRTMCHSIACVRYLPCVLFVVRRLSTILVLISRNVSWQPRRHVSPEWWLRRAAERSSRCHLSLLSTGRVATRRRWEIS